MIKLKSRGRERRNALMKRRPYPYSPEEERWLVREVPERTWTEIIEGFNTTFRASLNRNQIKRKAHKLGLKARRKADLGPIRSAWLAVNAETRTADELVESFNRHFQTKEGRKRIIRHCWRMGYGPRENSEEKAWLAEHAPRMRIGELTQAFNARFDVSISSEAIAKRCT